MLKFLTHCQSASELCSVVSLNSPRDNEYLNSDKDCLGNEGKLKNLK